MERIVVGSGCRTSGHLPSPPPPQVIATLYSSLTAFLYMPLFKKWSKFNKDNVESESNGYGVYELGDSDGNTIYVGEGKMRNRLNSHFLNNTHPIPKASYYRLEPTGSKLRAQQRERSEIRAHRRSTGRCPSYNMKLG